MYKSRFKRWGFAKNISRNCLAAMIRVQSERAMSGKPTAFDINKKQVHLGVKLQACGKTHYDIEESEPCRLPNSVRAYTPSSYYDQHAALDSRESLSLRDALFECAKILPFGGSDVEDDVSPWIEVGWGLGLGFSLSSRMHARLGIDICGQAFDVLHLLVRNPCLDSLMYFLVIPLVWPDCGVNRELWKYLAACPHGDTQSSLSVHNLFQTMFQYIEAHGTHNFLDIMEKCIGDLLIHLSKTNHPISKWDVMEWSQDMGLYSHLDGQTSHRAFSMVTKCLPLVGDSDELDPIWKVMEDLHTSISKKGVAHPDVFDIANKLLLKSQETDIERDHAYFQFHALTALAAFFKKRRGPGDSGHHPGHSLGMSYLKSANSTTKGTTSLAPVVRLENLFVAESWSRAAGDLDGTEKLHEEWESWVKSLELKGEAPRLS
ncbi:hypothetical protein MMYC01_205183 [Madurella mycetomatis]|uniref:Uncharacterized protein n=1 Tax=Madurella mycetomatis TaxID=100816 RepID=A0A175WBQ6_9PEZI|nr:hypothetical protein MMYC01_205183 [Madurella mycetomatis]